MLEMIMSNSELIIPTVTGIVTVASLLVAGTKTPAPDSVLGKIYKVLEFLSLTVGKAKETGKAKTMQISPRHGEARHGTLWQAW